MGSLTLFKLPSVCRRYAQSVQTGLKPQDESQKELEPLKLPGRLAEYTGNVMYPNEDSAVWDVNGKQGERERETSKGGRGQRMNCTVSMWLGDVTFEGLTR
jgi:hypothetical protein